MRYVLMGKSGLRVSELALGAMTFGADDWGVDKDESRLVYEGYREAGGNFVDTANVYSDGRSETFVGEFIASQRDEVVLATRAARFSRDRDVNTHGNSRKNMMASVHASLRRLNTDHIDLYWVHFKDHTTPMDEIMRGLDDLVTQGKVTYVGISGAPAWQVARGNTIAELRGWTPFVGLQIRYSPARPAYVEHELLPMARALDITVTPWDTLGQGVLTGKYNRSGTESGRATLNRPVSQRALDIAAVVVEVADEIGCSASHVALAWVRDRDGVVVPLVGARTRAQLDENLGCLDVVLSAEQRARLDAASAGRVPFPHNMIAGSVNSSVRTHRASQH